MLQNKYNQLKAIIKDMDSVIVAFSGGADSTFLLKVAVDVLGRERVLAITADSESYPTSELTEAEDLAEEIGANHKVIKVSELAIPGYKENTKDRCYFCKQGLFAHLKPFKEDGYTNIIYGVIADDMSDYRPGIRAAKESGARAPLEEAGLFKDEIRELSKQLKLATWDKPSYACLSSRVAYGEEITAEKLSKVEKSEDYLKQLGFRQVRVRIHQDIARIEVEQNDMLRFIELKQDIAEKVLSFGFKYVTLDLIGFKSGSMNKLLS